MMKIEIEEICYEKSKCRTKVRDWLCFTSSFLSPFGIGFAHPFAAAGILAD